ncbi:hypothetical protein AAFF_G00282570 [Aldrovandia affinis]|uniref:Uncharacterized protein n=1 Tax=Aldrovandia affinis TaxID=143900 RepID=A0AAD7X1P2_9TELE|nr:hypothetical protein AAFF_G00282570 [Aldrovandia affinis]
MPSQFTRAQPQLGRAQGRGGPGSTIPQALESLLQDFSRLAQTRRTSRGTVEPKCLIQRFPLWQWSRVTVSGPVVTQGERIASE